MHPRGLTHRSKSTKPLKASSIDMHIISSTFSCALLSSQALSLLLFLSLKPYIAIIVFWVFVHILKAERERSERDLISRRRQIMRKPCCCEKEETNKGAWSKQEDQRLIDYIQTHGEGFWRSLPKAAGLHRCGKSCRLRWINYLKPDIERGNFAQDEEDLIIKLHALLGNRWSLIAGRLPGRSDNEIKNYWNSHIRRKLMKMGIDPENHKLIHHLHHHRPHHDAAATSKENPISSSNLNLDLTMAFDPNSAEPSHNNNCTDKDHMDHRHTQSATATLPLFN